MSKITTTTPELQPLAIDAKTLAATLGLSVRSVRTMDCAGKLPRPIRLNGSVRWVLTEIESFLAAGAPDRATWEALKNNAKPEK